MVTQDKCICINKIFYYFEYSRKTWRGISYSESKGIGFQMFFLFEISCVGDVPSPPGLLQSLWTMMSLKDTQTPSS